MKRLSFLPMLLTTLLGGSMWGQDKMWDFPNMVNDTTIVRHWKGEEYIMYCRQGGMSRIVYHDNLSDSVVTSDWIEDFYLNDMCIVNDMVYGGGYVIDPCKKGMLACFSINEFLGTPNDTYTPIELAVFDEQYIYGPIATDEIGRSYYARITEVRRLAAHEESGQTWVAYIADNNIENEFKEVFYRRSGFGDAVHHTAVGWWPAGYNYNKDGAEIYTDICTTDNKIVVVGRDTSSLYAKVQVFNKEANYAAAYIYPNSSRYMFEDYTVHDRVMVTSVGGDTVALAHLCISGSISGQVVKVLDVSSGVPSLLHSQRIDAPKNNIYDWRMMDVVYSPNIDRLMMLNRSDVKNLGYGSFVYNVQMANIAAGQYQVLGTPMVGDGQALDNFGNDKFIVSGKGGGGSIHNGHVENNHPCGVDGQAVAKTNTPTMSEDIKHHTLTGAHSNYVEKKIYRDSDLAIIVCGNNF